MAMVQLFFNSSSLGERGVHNIRLCKGGSETDENGSFSLDR